MLNPYAFTTMPAGRFMGQNEVFQFSSDSSDETLSLLNNIISRVASLQGDAGASILTEAASFFETRDEQLENPTTPTSFAQYGTIEGDGELGFTYIGDFNGFSALGFTVVTDTGEQRYAFDFSQEVPLFGYADLAGRLQNRFDELGLDVTASFNQVGTYLQISEGSGIIDLTAGILGSFDEAQNPPNAVPADDPLLATPAGELGFSAENNEGNASVTLFGPASDVDQVAFTVTDTSGDEERIVLDIDPVDTGEPLDDLELALDAAFVDAGFETLDSQALARSLLVQDTNLRASEADSNDDGLPDNPDLDFFVISNITLLADGEADFIATGF